MGVDILSLVGLNMACAVSVVVQYGCRNRRGTSRHSLSLPISLFLFLFYGVLTTVSLSSSEEVQDRTAEVAVVGAASPPALFPDISPGALNATRAAREANEAYEALLARLMADMSSHATVTVPTPLALTASALRLVVTWAMHSIAGMLVLYVCDDPSMLAVLVHAIFSFVFPLAEAVVPSTTLGLLVKLPAFVALAQGCFACLNSSRSMPASSPHATLSATCPFILSSLLAHLGFEAVGTMLACELAFQMYLVFKAPGLYGPVGAPDEEAGAGVQLGVTGSRPISAARRSMLPPRGGSIELGASPPTARDLGRRTKHKRWGHKRAAGRGRQRSDTQLDMFSGGGVGEKSGLE